MTTEIEIRFIDSIDCKFPYHDRQKCLFLIDEAVAISANAIFSVAEEICRIPESQKGKVEPGYLLNLLAYTSSKFDHPLKEIIFDAATKMIYGKELTVEEVIKRMKIVKDHRGQFAAANILFFSCDDIDERLEPLMDSMVAEWEK